MSTFVKPLTQFGEAERVTMIFNVFLFFYVLTVSPNLFVCVCIKGQDLRVMPTNIIFEDKEKLLSP